MASLGATFKTEMVSSLLTYAPLYALIGNRLYALRAAQNPTTPYVVWQTVSAGSQHAHSGPTGMEEQRIQFSIFSATSASCEAIRDAIKDRFDGFKGTISGLVRCESCFFDNEIDIDPELATNLKQKVIDFRFMVKLIS